MTLLPHPAAVRCLRRLVIVAGLGLLAAATVLLVQWRQADSAAQRYEDAPCTTQPRPGVCPNDENAVVERTVLLRDDSGGPHPLVALLVGAQRRPLTVEGIWPTDAFTDLHPGSHVVLVSDEGRPTSLRLDPTAADPRGLRLWTIFNPMPDRDLLLDLGLSAAGVGLLALLLAAPSRLTRLPARRLADAFGDRRLRLAVLAMVVVQFLDVVTSIRGRTELLYEATSITRAMVDRFGDLGFLVVKVPAVLAVVLLAARLPRRWAIVPVLIAGTAVLVVVAGNIRLLGGQLPV